MEFNEKLQRLRKQKELTQEKLAEALYVSRTAISKWESGRGYPSIDSLKAISKLFSISIDDLLSSEELLTLAEQDGQEKINRLRFSVIGVLDCMAALFCFLPIFGQNDGERIRFVTLLSLDDSVIYMRAVFILIVSVTVAFGVCELALQNLQHRIWLKSKTMLSLSLTFVGVVVFIASLQPYAAVFLLCMLAIKGILLIKHR